MVGEVEPRKRKLNFRLDGPRDSHLTDPARDRFIKGLAAGGRKMSSTEVRGCLWNRISVGVVRERGLVVLQTYGSIAFDWILLAMDACS